MNFLLVDSKTQVRDILIRNLFTKGVNLYYGENLEDAQRIIKGTKVNMLLVDIDDLPTKSFAFLKTLGLMPNKPIRIVVSSLTDKNSIMPFVSIGIAGWIVKPFSEEKSLPKILEMINTLLPADEQRVFYRVSPARSEDPKVFFRLPASAKLYSATLLNISAGGLAVSMGEKVSETELAVNVFIPKIQVKLSAQYNMDLSGIVVYRSGNVFALRFKDCHERDIFTLSRYIFDHISQTVHSD